LLLALLGGGDEDTERDHGEDSGGAGEAAGHAESVADEGTADTTQRVPCGRSDRAPVNAATPRLLQIRTYGWRVKSWARMNVSERQPEWRKCAARRGMATASGCHLPSGKPPDRRFEPLTADPPASCRADRAGSRRAEFRMKVNSETT
jgi:hypothetical protein